VKTIPTNPKLFISDFNLVSKKPVYKNRTNTGKSLVISQQYQLYTGEIELTASGNQNVKTLAAFVESLDGGVEPFIVKLPTFKSLNALSGLPTLNEAYLVNTTEIKIDNFTGELVAGDYFNIANDTKLYMVTSGGIAGDTFQISPSLRKAQPQGTRISFEAQLLARIDNDYYKVQPRKTTENLQLTIKFTEDL